MPCPRVSTERRELFICPPPRFSLPVRGSNLLPSGRRSCKLKCHKPASLTFSPPLPPSRGYQHESFLHLIMSACRLIERLHFTIRCTCQSFSVIVFALQLLLTAMQVKSDSKTHVKCCQEYSVCFHVVILSWQHIYLFILWCGFYLQGSGSTREDVTYW